MTIYTGRGDAGETDVLGEGRVSKATPRIEAYGCVDELNSVIGMTIPTGHEDVDEQLEQVQQHLHIIQAQLADPSNDPDTPAISADEIETLEAWIDAADEELEPLAAFILPGGSTGGSRLHHARSVCRRSERRVVQLFETTDEEDSSPLVYLNRLSDLLFTLARVVNAREDHHERHPTY